MIKYMLLRQKHDSELLWEHVLPSRAPSPVQCSSELLTRPLHSIKLSIIITTNLEHLQFNKYGYCVAHRMHMVISIPPQRNLLRVSQLLQNTACKRDSYRLLIQESGIGKPAQNRSCESWDDSGDWTQLQQRDKTQLVWHHLINSWTIPLAFCSDLKLTKWGLPLWSSGDLKTLDTGGQDLAGDRGV